METRELVGVVKLVTVALTGSASEGEWVWVVGGQKSYMQRKHIVFCREDLTSCTDTSG